MKKIEYIKLKNDQIKIIKSEIIMYYFGILNSNEDSYHASIDFYLKSNNSKIVIEYNEPEYYDLDIIYLDKNI
jgi:hypothetical protein